MSTSVRPYPAPSGRTAQRLAWPHLPPDLRGQIEARLGSPVVTHDSRDSGFTPGFASVLTCADGTRHFVKAASTRAQRAFASAYREEGLKLSLLPPDIPAAGLLWSIDSEWLVLCIEYVEGRAPHRPWTAADLGLCLDALEVVADRLTPPPVGLDLDPARAEFEGWPELWDVLAEREDGSPLIHPLHLGEARALAARYAEVLDGDTVVHSDVRDDNVLITDHGAVFCDWNFPVRGCDWFDSFMMLIGPRGDGLDVSSVIAERRLLRDVPAEHVDIALALVAGYFLKSAGDRYVSNSPYLRDHQRWQGEVCWEWLAERRGWRAS